jgi:hypothetical protein
MKRTGFLGKLAILPAMLMGSSMLATLAPTATTAVYEGEASVGSFEGETGAMQVGTEGTRHLFAGVFDGRYMTSMFRSGFPTQAIVQWARENGFDRFEVWNKGKVIFQDTLVAGKVPQGWQSLEHAGHL